MNNVASSHNFLGVYIMIEQKNGWPTNLLEETIQACCDAITFSIFLAFFMGLLLFIFSYFLSNFLTIINFWPLIRHTFTLTPLFTDACLISWLMIEMIDRWITFKIIFANIWIICLIFSDWIQLDTFEIHKSKQL